MFLQNTYNYALGYTKIRIEGFFTERFINLCMNRNIKIWDIKSEYECSSVLKVKASDMKKVNEIADITRTKVEALETKGIPYIAKAYKKRKVFICFFLAIMVIIYCLSRRIWEIEIVGDFSIPISEIEDELQTENVRIGMEKDKIDFDRIKNNIYLRRSDILWIGFDINGTKAQIEVIERTNKDKDELRSKPCNIIANKDRGYKEN